MRNIDAEKQLKEAWNRKLEGYDTLIKMYKDQNYTIKRNEKTGDHIVEKNINYGMYKDNPFGNLFNF